jgi:thymidylate kinase
MYYGKIICIDGPSNTGKTSICRRIAKSHGFAYIKECTEEIKCPNPSRNREEEISNQSFYFDIEKKRMDKALELALSGKNVVLDRSLISVVAIAYAFEKLGKYDTFSHAKSKYIEFLRATKRPDFFVFVRADYSDICKRNATKNLPADWIGKEFTDLQERFNLIMTRILPNSILICTSSKSIDESSDEIINITQNSIT